MNDSLNECMARNIECYLVFSFFLRLLVGADDVKIEFDASLVVKPLMPHSFDTFDSFSVCVCVCSHIFKKETQIEGRN